MVKELTMDNSIFSLGANADTNLSANDASVANEFQAAFETAKNNYADQKEFNNDSQKVVKVAEKAVNVEKDLNQKTEHTEVYKKVSTDTKTKSPQTQNINTTSQAQTEADVNGVSDTYSFTIKESISSEQDSTKATVEEQEVELTSENLSSIEENVSTEETVIENNTSSLENTKTKAQTIVTEIVNFVAEKLSNISTSKNGDDSEENEEEESSTTLLDTLTAETAENVLDLTLQTTDETVEEVIVMTDDTNLDTALESDVADTESTVDTTTGAAADIELEIPSDSKGIELGEGWEILDAESQQPLTKEEFDNLVSNNTKEIDLKANETVLNADAKDLAPMDELNVEDVKFHTLEEIESGKNLQQKVENVDSNINLNNETEIITQNPKEQTLATQNTETDINFETNIKTGGGQHFDSKEETDEPLTDNKLQSVENTVELQTEELVSINDTNIEVDADLNLNNNEIKSESVEVNKNLENTGKETVLKEENSSIKINNKTEDVTKTDENSSELNATIETEPSSDIKISENNTSKQAEVEIGAEEEMPATDSKINFLETDSSDNKTIVTTENIEETIDEIVNNFEVKAESDKIDTEINPDETIENSTKNDNNFSEFNNNETDNQQEFVTVKDNKEIPEADLDKLINDSIKLAFVDTTSSISETETIDVISALENKFAENMEAETEVEFATNTEIVEEDIDTQEQVSSLEEVVDVEEFEELNVQLRDSQKATSSEKTTSTSNTVNSTTEQLIRFSIEGETGYEPTAEFTTFKTEVQTPAQQTTASSAKEVLAQLSEKLSTFSLKAGSKLTMQLSPENLGKIEIKLTNTAQGIIAEMSVSSDETYDMMKKNLDELKDTLQKYGVRFDNVTVKTNAAQQSTNQQDYTEQNNHQKQQQEQNKDNEKQKNKSNSFEDMVNSFTKEETEE